MNFAAIMDLSKLTMEQTMQYLTLHNIREKIFFQSKTQLFKNLLKSNPELCDLPGLVLDTEFKKKICLSHLYKMIIIFNDNNNNKCYKIFETTELNQIYQQLNIYNMNKTHYMALSIFENNINSTHKIISAFNLTQFDSNKFYPKTIIEL